MLEKLSKQHSKWIKYAFGLCKSKQQSEDMVQDMYIKVYECNLPIDKQTNGYIYAIIRNSYVSTVTKGKRMQFTNIDSCFNLEYKVEEFEIDDHEYKALYLISELSEINKRILFDSLEVPIEVIAKREGIARESVYRRLQRTKKRLRND